MVDQKPRKILPLMELKIVPLAGYPKLPKWDSYLKYRLKDQSLLNEVENPFHIDSDLSPSVNDIKISDMKKRKRPEFLPKNPPPPHNRMEEIENYFNRNSGLKTKSTETQERDQKIPVRYKTVSESCESITSNISSNTYSYLEVYLEIKKAKALLLKKFQDDLNSSEMPLISDDKHLSVLVSKENSVKLESSFLSKNQRTTKNNRISKTIDLNSLTKQLEEYFI